MFLLLIEGLMNNIHIIFLSVIIFILQLLLVDFLSLNLIRPNFLVIYVLYISLYKGRLFASILGFSLGLLSDFFGVGSYFGLEPLCLSIVGYLGGFLNNSYEKLLPYIFHSSWVLIIFLHFFILCYFRFQNLYMSDFSEFLMIWLLSTLYTLLFVFPIQFIFPLKEASHAEIS